MRKLISYLVILVLLSTTTASAGEIGSYEVPLSIAVSPMNAENACLAASYLDGVTVLPGEEFSFNNTVGRRTTDKGYRSGYIASPRSRNEMAIGGGVCMTASILHQAVKSAGLDVVERHNHSIRISYLPLGEDAAVYYGVEDFRFINSLNVPITIRSTVTDSLKIAIATEDRKRQVMFNGSLLEFDTQPVLQQDRLMVPLWTMNKAMNGQLTWDSPTQTAKLSRGNTVMEFKIGESKAMVNNQEKSLGVPIKIINNRTMVPLRFLSEEMGMKLNWDEVTQTAFVEEQLLLGLTR